MLVERSKRLFDRRQAKRLVSAIAVDAGLAAIP